MINTKVLLALGCTALVMAGCASAPAAADANNAATEPLVHEYRVGSLRAQKDRHVTTEEERKRAQEVAEQIRASGSVVGDPAGATR